MAKGYEVKVLNLDEVISDFEALEDIDMTQLLRQAGVLVQDEAKRNVPAKSGTLRNSITHYLLDDKTVVVGSNLNYAPYVEYGTGKFAKNGNGRQGYWVYVEGYTNPGEPNHTVYTYDEAIRIYWGLVNQGIPQERIWITSGQHPQPFLEPALDAQRENIANLFTAAIHQTAAEKGRKK